MTSEPMTELEQRLAAALNHYAQVATPVPYSAKPITPPASRRFPLLAAAAVTLLAIIGVGAVQLANMSASRPADARVNGMTYDISIARSLVVDEEDLTAVGDVDTTENYLFADSIAYAVDGVDPDDALVARVASGQRDDAGPLGDWILLMRGEIGALCPYFDPDSASTPAECRGEMP